MIHHIAVISQKKDPFTIIVKATNREKPDGIISEFIHNCCPTFRIADCCHFTNRFVICDIMLLIYREYLKSVYTDCINGFINLNSHCGDNISVYRNMSIHYHFFSISPGSYTAKSKIFLKAQCFSSFPIQTGQSSFREICV